MRALDGRAVLVVGASSGIGRAAAVHLAQRGARVAAVGRRAELLDELDATAIVADVRDPGACQRLVAEAVTGVGAIDAMVFAASAATLARSDAVDAEVWRSVLETNVVAPALVTAALLPHLRGAGFLGFLSSEMVGQPYHGLTHYATSKAALEELVRGLRVEHPEHRFCCIRVGATEGTDFGRDFSAALGAELYPEWIARGRLPAAFMTADDVGGVIADVVVAALERPGIDVQDLTLRAPGAPHTGTIDELVERQR